MMVSDVSKTDWARLIRAEFQELPGLCLTRAQVQRMWGLDGTTCDALLEQLVQTGFLKETRDREYVRVNKGY